MLVVLGAAMGLVLTCVAVHYESLRLTSRFLPHLHLSVRLKVAAVVLACLAAHAVEVLTFALAYYGLSSMGFGKLTGEIDDSFGDYFYFSITSYSTLGIGDVAPHGVLRILSGVEALLGLFLVAWSTSFTYLAMERLWALHTRVDRPDEADR